MKGNQSRDDELEDQLRIKLRFYSAMAFYERIRLWLNSNTIPTFVTMDYCQKFQSVVDIIVESFQPLARRI
jgi:hypothetical protein